MGHGRLTNRLPLALPLLGLVLLLAGCAGNLRVGPEAGETPPPSNKPRAQKTLPAAVGAWFRCLHDCPCQQADDEKTKTADDQQQGKKNPDTNPDDKDKDKEKDKENGNGKAKAKAVRQTAAKQEPDKKDEEKGKKNPDDKGDGEDKKDDDKKEDDKKEEEKKPPENLPAWLSAHGQLTVISQAHDHFRSPYIGAHSLLPFESPATSETATLFLDARLWDGGEIVFNPETAGGRGFSGTQGIAGFPNGEITRVGVGDPTPYIARLYFRQTIGFGGEQENVEDGPNLLPGKRDIDRLTFTIGKFTATDIVDDNRYSHDPRTQFQNWSLMYNGAWDYPANVRGYTYGMALDANSEYWALRYAIVAEPTVANGAPIDAHFVKAHAQMLELENRWCVEKDQHAGHLRLLAYLNNAHMGDYRETLDAMPVNPDITATRSYRMKYGVGLSFDQEVTKNLGVFARLGWNDGHSETWAFTEIDRTAALGFQLKGACWCRPFDEVGIAGVLNGLSQDHRNYLAAGGVGYIIGDGQLSYAPEQILELYYNWSVYKGVNATIDFQEVNHPAYNSDRGPVSVVSLRVHFEF